MAPRDEINQVHEAYSEVSNAFPFPEYMQSRFQWYIAVGTLIKKELPAGRRILDVGCGPCDLTAILSKLGYSTTGVDDLRDPWHLIGNNKLRIKRFAKTFGVNLIVQSASSYKEDNRFDAVLLMDVLEHNTRPRELLNHVISFLKPKGLLFIESPNSAALGKRMRLLLGRSVWPDFNIVYFNVGDYRTHVREYSVSELLRMLRLSGLINIKFVTKNFATQERIHAARRIRKIMLRAYEGASKLRYSFRDTVLMWGAKPSGWSPFGDYAAFEFLKKYHPQLATYNLDGEITRVTVQKLQK